MTMGDKPPGTEILDAETKRQKSSFKRANARRDQNPGTEWPEIPAETRYSASCRKRAVCGDWMVVCAVAYEPVSADPLFSPVPCIFSGIKTYRCYSFDNRVDLRNRRLSQCHRVTITALLPEITATPLPSTDTRRASPAT